MSTVTRESSPPVDESEAFKVLVGRVGRNASKIPAEVLARHVLETVPAQEWPVRVEAMEALLRRLESARKDELRIESRPENGNVLGLYATRRRGSDARPYRTIVLGRGSSAGAMRLSRFPQELAGALQAHPRRRSITCTPGRGSASRRGASRNGSAQRTVTGPVWDPIRPLLGFGDWLDRVTWLGADSGKVQGARASRALAWFRLGRNGSWTLEEHPFRRSGEAAGAGREPAQGCSGRGRRESGTTRPCAPCSSTSAARLKRIVETTLWPSEQKSVMRGLKCPLYPYQRDGVKRFLETGRLLLADDMGLGKTAQAIACCDILWRTGRVRRGLIIAPASLKPQWAREWAHFSDLPIEVIDGNPDRTPGDLRHPQGRLLHHQLRATDPRSGDRPGLEPRPGRARRGAADQELGDQDGALGQGAQSAVPAGADRHADGEPDRGAGLDRRVGRRHGARAQVAASRAARDARATAARRSSACGISTPSANGSGPAWSAGSARRCSTSSRRAPTSACRSR